MPQPFADTAYYHMDDEEYWDAPGRYRTLQGSWRSGQVTNVRGTHFPLGDPDDDNAPVAAIIKMEPGAVLTRHAHDCERFEIVIQGELHTRDTVLRPGDVMMSHALKFYGPGVAGPEGCMTCEIFSRARGSHSLWYERAGTGEVFEWNQVENQGLRIQRDAVAGNEATDPEVAARVAAILEITKRRSATS